MPYYVMFTEMPLPVTPAAISIKTPSLNRTVSLVNEGEINIPKGAGLREISFDFLLPSVQKYPFANFQLSNYTAQLYILAIENLKKMMIPFYFIVTRMSPSFKIIGFTLIKCVIEEFTFDEDAEAHGLDTMCSITLKEYKDYGTKRVEKIDPETKTAEEKKTRPSESKKQKSTVKAQEGDTVANVAKKETGSFDNTDKIAEANGYKTYDSTISISELEKEMEGKSTQELLDEWEKNPMMMPTEESIAADNVAWINENLKPIAPTEATKVAESMLPKTAPTGTISLAEPVKAGTEIKLSDIQKLNALPSTIR